MKIVKTALAVTGIAALAACGQSEQDNTTVVENLTAENLVIQNDMNDMNTMDMNMTGDTLDMNATGTTGMNDMNGMDNAATNTGN